MARLRFATSGGDVAALIADPSTGVLSLPASSAGLVVWDSFEDGSQVTDLALDEAGSSAITLAPGSTRANPQGVFYGPDGYEGSLYVEDANGLRWRVDPDNIAELGGDSGAAAAALAAQAAAETAAGSASAAAASAAAALASVQAIPAGAPGVSGRTHIKFRQEGEAAQAVNIQPEVIPFPFTIDGAVVTTSKAPTAAPVQVDVTRDGFSLWANSSNRPTNPINKKAGAFAIPDSNGPYASMTELSVNVTSVGDSTSTSLTPAIKGILTADSGSGSASSFTIPTTGYLAPDGVTPVSIAAGDGMAIWITSGQPAGLPGGYATGLSTEAVAANVRGRAAYRTATGTSADGADITLGTGSPFSYKIALISNPGGTEGAVATAPTAGNTAGSSALTTTGTDEIGVWFAGWRASSGAQPNIGISGGAAPTELRDTVTTRTGTNTNFGSAVAWKSLPAAGTAASTTYTATGGTSVQWVEAVVAIKSGVGAGSPGENVTVTLWIREFVDPEVGGGE